MDATRITFIGAGNMAYALIKGLLTNGHPAEALHATDPVASQRQRIADLGILTSATNEAGAAQADVIVLAVKPQVLGQVLAQITTLDPAQLLVSIAAGVPLASLEGWSTATQPIVRCMPNTPALLGAGITAMHANQAVSAEQKALAETILGTAGKTLWVPQEAMLDAVTAVSGSGPAYFFYLMEAMIDAGQALGLDRDTATLLTLETAYGAALMARGGSDSPAELRRNVTSPGGTTARALSILDAGHVDAVVREALAGAAARSKELAEEFGKP